MSKLTGREIEMLMNEDYEGEMSRFEKKQIRSMGSGRQDATRSKDAKAAAKAKRAPKTLEEASERKERNEKINASKKLAQQKAVAAKQAEKSGADMDSYKFRPKRNSNYGTSKGNRR